MHVELRCTFRSPDCSIIRIMSQTDAHVPREGEKERDGEKGDRQERNPTTYANPTPP